MEIFTSDLLQRDGHEDAIWEPAVINALMMFMLIVFQIPGGIGLRGIVSRMILSPWLILVLFVARYLFLFFMLLSAALSFCRPGIMADTYGNLLVMRLSAAYMAVMAIPIYALLSLRTTVLAKSTSLM